jgi:DNA-binding IclR family transcriptional regulator
VAGKPVAVDLNIWQNALYFQLKERPRTVAQLASANALPEAEVLKVLNELEALHLATNDDSDTWHLTGG